MQGRGPTQRGSVRVGARLDEVLDDRPLTDRIPIRCAGSTADGRMQRFGAPTVASAEVGAARDQIFGELDVVRERRGMQRRVAFVDLDLTLGDEALVAARQPRRCQLWCRVERRRDDYAIARRDGHQQPGEIFDGRHTARYLGQAASSLAIWAG